MRSIEGFPAARCPAGPATVVGEAQALFHVDVVRNSTCSDGCVARRAFAPSASNSSAFHAGEPCRNSPETSTPTGSNRNLATSVNRAVIVIVAPTLQHLTAQVAAGSMSRLKAARRQATHIGAVPESSTTLTNRRAA